MIESFVTLKALGPAAAFALLFVGERLSPATPAPGPASRRRARLKRNGAFWLVLLVASPLVALPLTVWATEAALWTRTGALAAPATILADVVVLDLWTWAMHRAYHETPLWRLHIVHHLDEHLDTTSAGRFHLGEIAVSAAARTPLLAMLAMPLQHVLVFDALLVSAALFQHSNLRLPRPLESALSRVVVTPSIHWVHHHAEDRDTHANYGAILSVWDRLFGTRSATARTVGMPIGLAGAGDRTLSELARLPFTPRRIR